MPSASASCVPGLTNYALAPGEGADLEIDRRRDIAGNELPDVIGDRFQRRQSGRVVRWHVTVVVRRALGRQEAVEVEPVEVDLGNEARHIATSCQESAPLA